MLTKIHFLTLLCLLVEAESSPVIRLADPFPLKLNLAQFGRLASSAGSRSSEVTCTDERYGDLTSTLEAQYPKIGPANRLKEHSIVYTCKNPDGGTASVKRSVIIVPTRLLSAGLIVALAISIAAVLVCLTTSSKVWDIQQQHEIRGLGQAKRNRSFLEGADDEGDGFQSGIEMQGQRNGFVDDSDSDSASDDENGATKKLLII
jgi:hypothetical protein